MQQVTEDQMDELRLYGEKVHVNFYAPWSSQCKMLEPFLESLQMDYSNIQFENNTNLMFANQTYIGMNDVLCVRQKISNNQW